MLDVGYQLDDFFFGKLPIVAGHDVVIAGSNLGAGLDDGFAEVVFVCDDDFSGCKLDVAAVKTGQVGAAGFGITGMAAIAASLLNNASPRNAKEPVAAPLSQF